MTLVKLRPAEEASIDGVRIVRDQCRRCGLLVNVIAVGDEHMPVFLDITPITVVGEGGRVHVGYPLHEEVACAAREALR